MYCLKGLLAVRRKAGIFRIGCERVVPVFFGVLGGEGKPARDAGVVVRSIQSVPAAGDAMLEAFRRSLLLSPLFLSQSTTNLIKDYKALDRHGV
jgi:hypothetical protein